MEEFVSHYSVREYEEVPSRVSLCLDGYEYLVRHLGYFIFNFLRAFYSNQGMHSFLTTKHSHLALQMGNVLISSYFVLFFGSELVFWDNDIKR